MIWWQLWVVCGFLGSATLVWAKSHLMPTFYWRSLPAFLIVLIVVSVMLGPLMLLLAYNSVSGGPDGEA